MARFDQPIDLPQRILAAAPRPEAEAPRMEMRLQDGFQHEFDRRLGNAVLDRGYSQRPHPAIPLRDLHAPDRRRTVFARPQLSRQLRQIGFGVRREPFDALPVHTRRAAAILILAIAPILRKSPLCFGSSSDSTIRWAF